jgi:endonuclease G
MRLAVVLWLMFIMDAGLSHPGGRDANGCHICRSNCEIYNLAAGERHCHDSVITQPAQPIRDVLRLDYEGFTVWLDCSRRGAIKFRYNAQRDQGNEKRYSRFHLDPSVPEHCQQTSAASYKTKPPAPRYDRGHLVPANHLDASKVSIRQSNYMTNILPQVASMNRGAWLLTEEIVECYRDIDELLIIGGVVWGENTNNGSPKKVRK